MNPALRAFLYVAAEGYVAILAGSLIWAWVLADLFGADRSLTTPHVIAGMGVWFPLRFFAP